MFADYLLV
jgi:transmembrane 9 superfamily protein 2/4